MIAMASAKEVSIRTGFWLIGIALLVLAMDGDGSKYNLVQFGRTSTKYCANILLQAFLILVLLRSCRVILMYSNGPVFPGINIKGEVNWLAGRSAVMIRADHRSLVELRWRLRMYSRTAEWAYRTARPILMKRGPVPFSLDLASQDEDTLSTLATCAGCSRGSIS